MSTVVTSLSLIRTARLVRLLSDAFDVFGASCGVSCPDLFVVTHADSNSKYFARVAKLQVESTCRRRRALLAARPYPFCPMPISS